MTNALTAYLADRSIANRNRVVEEHMDFVDKVVTIMTRNVPQCVTDDLRSEACIGLIRAVERFDPSRGVKFTSYLSLRIRGAVKDGCRAVDSMPRMARERARKWNQVADQLSQSIGRPPTPEEVEASLGIEPGEWDRDLMVHRISPITGTREVEDDYSQLDGYADPDAVEPGAALEADEEFERLIDTDFAYESDKLMLRLRFKKDMSMRQIGRIIGRTESRVSQQMSIFRGAMRAQRLAA
jgi:RNA polymerase sigma factor for flagellar operon FliA